MRKLLAIVFAISTWFAVIVQFFLMLQNRVASVPETIIRFFSFFTILTNALVAIYFTGQAFNIRFTNKAGVLTAVTVYIFIVGIVYQVLLRQIWQPTGMQQVVDEMLHTFNPLVVMLYWYLYEKKEEIHYYQIKKWMIYPVAYFVLINIRGAISGFYPYPFINVSQIGWTKAMSNSGLLTIFFVAVAFIFIAIGRKTSKYPVAI